VHSAARLLSTARALAGLGIPATAGFGVAYDGLHATDERIFIPSIPLVQATYHGAVLALLS
jgi:succinyl-diaminopimelate desuccinylase